MGWAEAIKGALAALPILAKQLDRFIDAVHTLAVTIQDNRLQEVRNAQTLLVLEIQKVQSDEQRAVFAKRIAELERKH